MLDNSHVIYRWNEEIKYFLYNWRIIQSFKLSHFYSTVHSSLRSLHFKSLFLPFSLKLLSHLHLPLPFSIFFVFLWISTSLLIKLQWNFSITQYSFIKNCQNSTCFLLLLSIFISTFPLFNTLLKMIVICLLLLSAQLGLYSFIFITLKKISIEIELITCSFHSKNHSFGFYGM